MDATHDARSRERDTDGIGISAVHIHDERDVHRPGVASTGDRQAERGHPHDADALRRLSGLEVGGP
jgi:hypothetical protein